MTASMLVESKPCWISEDMVLSERPSLRNKARNSGSAGFLGSTGRGVCGPVGAGAATAAGRGVTGGGAATGTVWTGTGGGGKTAAACTGTGAEGRGAAKGRLGSGMGTVTAAGRGCGCRCCCI